MSTAGLLIATRPSVATSRNGSPRLGQALPGSVGPAGRAAMAAGLDEVVVVVSDEADVQALPAGLSVLLDRSGAGSAGALRSAIDYLARAGHTCLVGADLTTSVDLAVVGSRGAWRALADRAGSPIIIIPAAPSVSLFRLVDDVWPVVPFEGALASLWESRPELVSVLLLEELGNAAVHDDGVDEVPDTGDRTRVAELLGREPQGPFDVVVRDRFGAPVVIENAPFLDDGTPMPTRFWLVGKAEREVVSRLESEGGAKAAESELGEDVVLIAHERYARERDELIGRSHVGPRPSGGVGGTRKGVKCLHAHLANYLAGGRDPVGAWVVARVGDQIDGSIAAVDCGTNSTRLLVVSPTGRTLARETIITRLGEGVDATGKLARQAIDRTLAALTHYREVCDGCGVVRVRATATSAARDASNAEELFGPAKQILGVSPETIEGTEEGRLSYAGATVGLDDGPYLVVDLGGGSTELVAGAPQGAPDPISAVVSLDVGCVRVSERFLHADPPDQRELDEARAYVEQVINKALEAQPALRAPRKMIGVAGTVSTLAALALGLEHYNSDAVHHYELSRATVRALLADLASKTAAERREMPGIEAGRADVIVGGAVVLDQVLASTGHATLVHSETDILDGVAAELLAGLKR